MALDLIIHVVENHCPTADLIIYLPALLELSEFDDNFD